MQGYKAGSGAALLLSATLPGLAAATEPGGPPDIVSAFSATCQRGFPNLDAVRSAALADGWVERSIRPVGGNAQFQSASLPRVFQKGSHTLFLMTPNGTGMKHACQVGGPADASVDLARLAAASQAFGVGAPVVTREHGTERAQWRSNASTLIASVHRRPRQVTLVVQVEP